MDHCIMVYGLMNRGMSVYGLMERGIWLMV